MENFKTVISNNAQETVSPNDFINHYRWYEAVVGGSNFILRGRSALEYLGYFSGYGNFNVIEVYALEAPFYSNIRYFLKEDFSSIEHFEKNGVLCSTLNQAVNDILGNIHLEDEQPLVEALSYYYYKNNSSFAGLNISRDKRPQFEALKQWAIEYYDEVN